MIPSRRPLVSLRAQVLLDFELHRGLSQHAPPSRSMSPLGSVSALRSSSTNAILTSSASASVLLA